MNLANYFLLLVGHERRFARTVLGYANDSPSLFQFPHLMHHNNVSSWRTNQTLMEVTTLQDDLKELVWCTQRLLASSDEHVCSLTDKMQPRNL